MGLGYRPIARQPRCYGRLIDMKNPSSSEAQNKLTRSPFTSELPDLSNASHTKLSLMAGALAHKLSHIFPRWLDQHMSNKWDLTGPRLMLVAVVNRSGSLTMSEAAELLDVTPRAITRLVDGLEADGLVARTPSSTDKRVANLTITASAKSKIKKLLPVHEERMGELFSGFTDDELREYVRLNNKFLRRLKELADRED